MKHGAAASDDPMKLFFADLVMSAETNLDRSAEALDCLRQRARDGDALYRLARAFHAIKGNSSFFERAAVTPIAAAAEEAAERLQQQGGDCPPDVLDLLARVVARLRLLMAESSVLGSLVQIAAEDEVFVMALAAVVPIDVESRYRFWGADVTAQVQALAEAADQPQLPPEKQKAVAMAATELARLAREADVHDVARAIEAVNGTAASGAAGSASGRSRGAPDSGPAGDSRLDTVVLRGALRALAPLLQREAPEA